jgi:hypothetical protein
VKIISTMRFVPDFSHRQKPISDIAASHKFFCRIPENESASTVNNVSFVCVFFLFNHLPVALEC